MIHADWTGLPPVDLAALAAAFGERLHRAGLPVTPERSARFAAAVSIAPPESITQLYWIGRATLTSHRSHAEVFDREFNRAFRGVMALGDAPGASAYAASGQEHGSPNDVEDADQDHVALGASGEGTSATPAALADDDEGESTPALLAAASTAEVLSDREFSELTEAELLLIQQLVERLPVIPPMRSARRQVRSTKGTSWDIRATVRAARRTGGDPVKRVMRSASEKPRRVVLLADVSGSMEPYARVYLHLMRGAVRALGSEAFVFATHITRITRALSLRDPHDAYRMAADAVTDWSGGTRIGESIQTFINEYGRRGMARGAVIVIVSDGWEVADPAQVSRAMAQLSRLAHHIIWVNPRKAAPDYQPLAGGMAAAMPYVDTFLSGHSVNSLSHVIEAIAAARVRRSPGARSPLAA